MSALGISPYFKYCFCSNDVVNRKPHPEVFQLAADSINVKNSECLVFEDTPCGIKASKGLNMMCFALATTYQPELLKDSDYIMHSFEDFPWELVSFKPKLISRNT